VILVDSGPLVAADAADTPAASATGGADAINLIIKQVRRLAHAVKDFDYPGPVLGVVYSPKHVSGHGTALLRTAATYSNHAG
jgi:hypothetical protein